MIDTIVITLNSAQYQIIAPELFTPPAHWVLAETHRAHAIQSKQNPTLLRQDSGGQAKLGIYKPRLTLSNRTNAMDTREITLKIELSLPKLLFGNNFEELRLKDFTAVADKL